MVCLLLCLHAYFIFNVRDEAVQTSVSADTKLGGWGGEGDLGGWMWICWFRVGRWVWRDVGGGCGYVCMGGIDFG